MAETAQLKRIIEAALLASAQPLTLPQISGLFDEFDMPPHDDLARAIEELKNDSAERGVELVEVASGYRYQVQQDVHAFVSRLWTERPSRYSRALLETLCLIAYRQPITRAEIEQIRGVAVSTHIVRTLEEREWVRVVGYRDLPGKPALFGTTKQFLDYFNLKSLDQLPPLSEIREIEDLDLQLALDGGAPIPAAVAFDEGAGDDADADADAEPAESAAGAEAEAGMDETQATPAASAAPEADARTETPSSHGGDQARASDPETPIDPAASTDDGADAADDAAAPTGSEAAPAADDSEPTDHADDGASPSTKTTAPAERAGPDPSDTSA